MTDSALFDALVKDFVVHVQKLNNDYFAKNFPKQGCIISVEEGPKNIRVVKQNTYDGVPGSGRSVYCFINKETGDLLKGSWKAPVKNGMRGNLYKVGSWENFDQHGPKYLR